MEKDKVGKTRSYSEVKALCKPEGVKETFLARWAFRPVSYFILKFIEHLPFTPNHWSLVRGAVGILGFIMFLYGWFITGALLFILSHFIDYWDGGLARLKDQGSKFGQHLDFFFDHTISTILYFAAVGVAMQSWRVALVYIFLSQTAFGIGFLFKKFNVNTEWNRRSFLMKHFYGDSATFVEIVILIIAITGNWTNGIYLFFWLLVKNFYLLTALLFGRKND